MVQNVEHLGKNISLNLLPGVYKVAFPPPWGGIESSCWGRREGERKKGRGSEEGKGRRRREGRKEGEAKREEGKGRWKKGKGIINVN